MKRGHVAEEITEAGTKSNWVALFLTLHLLNCYLYNKQLRPLESHKNIIPLFLSHTFFIFSRLQNFCLFPITQTPLASTFNKFKLQWVDHLVVTKMASRKDHGHQKKTRNSLITFRNMGTAIGEYSQRMLVCHQFISSSFCIKKEHY